MGIYSVLSVPEDLTECVTSMATTLKFTVKDCDPATGEPDSDEGYDDEYQLEDLDITVADYVQRVMKGNFAAAWEELGEAVKNIVMYLGLQPCERSDKVPEGKSSHTLLLSGVFRGGHGCWSGPSWPCPTPWRCS